MGVLNQMQPIGLDEMKSVRLMNRVDQKYMASVDRLEELLERVADGYYVQRIQSAQPCRDDSEMQDSELIAPYRTLYFDTEGLDMYMMHHNGKLNRQKLRVRTYRSTDTTFFEIKNKDNKKKTSKVRIPIDVSMFDRVADIAEVREFVERNTPYSFNSQFTVHNSQFTIHNSPFTIHHSQFTIHHSHLLHECLENRFERITLVDKGMSERVTIDKGIMFHNRATGIDADIAHLLVIEVKHEVGVPLSQIERALHEMHILPRRMSKYCIGTALTDPSVKHNRFKPKLLYIAKEVKEVIEVKEVKDNSNY